MKRTYIFLTFLVISFFAGAQQDRYIIRYDVVNNQQEYLIVRKGKDTSQTSVIDLTRSNQVTLQVNNLAGSFKQSIEYKYKEAEQGTIVNPWWGQAINGVGGLSNLSSLTGILTKASGADGNGVEKDLKSMEINEAAAARSQFLLRYNQFADVYSTWFKAYVFEQNCRSLWLDLSRLRYNLQYPSEKVKQLSRTKTNEFMPGAADDPDLLLAQGGAGNTTTAFKNLTEAFGFVRTAMDNYSAAKVSAKDRYTDSLYQLAANIMDKGNRLNTASGNEDATTYLGRIVNVYKQILQDTYVRTVPLEIGSRTRAAVIRLTPVIDSVTMQALSISISDTTTREITIYKKAPLRFRNTYGMSFVYFNVNRWHYFVKTQNNVSVIAREGGDFFQPVLATLLHFYSPRDKGFRWGGSFGAGVPISGESTNLNILVGLSTFLGKNDPLCITAGVSGAKVKKLSGYQPGDVVSFQQLNANDYNQVYRIGFFIGITFNPAALNAKD